VQAVKDTLFSIGHSNHELAEFLGLLGRAGITALADVRSQPYSRRHPYYNRPDLEAALAEARITYVFLGHALGGRPEDPDVYDAEGRVDYELVRKTYIFKQGLEELMAVKAKKTALFCAEEDPLDCHRGLMIAPALMETGVATCHLRGNGSHETMAQMEERLLAETHVGEGFLDGLFAELISPEDRRELLAKAYRLQARRKAFRMRPGGQEDFG
jgi:uncharacterized protein (DUF488 family)